MRRAERGFTLVELLVVMIIIGILAAIAVPVFLNQRQKARDTAVKADLAVLGKGIIAYWANGSQTAPTIALSGGTVLVGGETAGRLSTGVALLDYAAPPVPATSLSTSSMVQNQWCVNMRDAQNANATVYRFSAQGGLSTGPCTNATTP